MLLVTCSPGLTPTPRSYAQIASIPVGYNNAELAKAARSPEMVDAIINRPALGNFPPTDWASVLKTGILKVAPKGLNQVFTADRKSTRLNSSHSGESRMPSSA